jgi:hypothetical protein
MSFSQARFAALQQWFYKAERSGVLSDDVNAIAAKVPIPPPTMAEIIAFKKAVANILGVQRPNPHHRLDIDLYKDAAKLEGAVRTYQATRTPPIAADGQMNAATWAALAREQRATEPNLLDPKTTQAFAAAQDGVSAIQQKTIRDLTTAHGLWMKVREAAGKPVQGMARDPFLSLSSGALESQLGHPAFVDNGSYFGTLQINHRGQSWFADPAFQKTVIDRLKQMAQIAGPNADKDLKGEWNEARLVAQYKTNNYIQAAAYNEHMSNVPTPEGKTIYDKAASLYIAKHLLPEGKKIMDANPNSRDGLYALALKKGNDPQTWGRYMIGNSGVFMRETLKDTPNKYPNEWMAKNLGTYTKTQLSFAFKANTLQVDGNKLITDNPQQIRANAAHHLQTLYEGIKNPKPRPVSGANITVATSTLPQPAGAPAANANTTAPEAKTGWRGALNSVGWFGKW